MRNFKNNFVRRTLLVTVSCAKLNAHKVITLLTSPLILRCFLKEGERLFFFRKSPKLTIHLHDILDSVLECLHMLRMVVFSNLLQKIFVNRLPEISTLVYSIILAKPQHRSSFYGFKWLFCVVMLRSVQRFYLKHHHVHWNLDLNTHKLCLTH